MSKESYTSANAMPMKVLTNEHIMRDIKRDGIRPYHIQIAPTNNCNLACPFCSCDDREKDQELSWSELEDIIHISRRAGTMAYTITGGGEPTLHPHINEFINTAKLYGIDSGLVSNGLAVNNLERKTIDNLTWARVSFGDFRKFNKKFEDNMNYLRESSGVDLAFSYVLSDNPNEENLKKIVNYANENDFTHIRIVSDILNPNIVPMNRAKFVLKDEDTSRVIFQGRTSYTKGNKDCKISLLKPLIAPDGYIYPCCGVQYSINGTKNTFPTQMRMGHFRDLPSIIKSQKNFDGSVCDKCYYEDYNATINAIQKPLNHKRFV